MPPPRRLLTAPLLMTAQRRTMTTDPNRPHPGSITRNVHPSGRTTTDPGASSAEVRVEHIFTRRVAQPERQPPDADPARDGNVSSESDAESDPDHWEENIDGEGDSDDNSGSDASDETSTSDVKAARVAGA